MRLASTGAFTTDTSVMVCHTVSMVPMNINVVSCFLLLQPTVFREPQNFELSRRICPFLWNFDIAMEFRGILQKFRND